MWPIACPLYNGIFVSLLCLATFVIVTIETKVTRPNLMNKSLHLYLTTKIDV